jgi:hypothetical protein
MPFHTSYYNDTEAEMVDLVNRCKKERKETRRKEGKAFGTLNRRIDARRSMTQSVQRQRVGRPNAHLRMSEAMRLAG